MKLVRAFFVSHAVTQLPIWDDLGVKWHSELGSFDASFCAPLTPSSQHARADVSSTLSGSQVAKLTSGPSELLDAAKQLGHQVKDRGYRFVRSEQSEG